MFLHVATRYPGSLHDTGMLRLYPHFLTWRKKIKQLHNPLKVLMDLISDP